jgi:hypothetical protein
MPSQVKEQRTIATLTRVEGEEYLESLDTLARELDRAMDAIATRSLGSFEDSVARQLSACGRLTAISSRASASASVQVSHAQPVSGPTILGGCEDANLQERITDATATLVTLNRRYSALLKHSGDTIRLFAGVFRSYPGLPETKTGFGGGVSTWSCEL